MATTQSVWDHHAQSFLARDVAAVLEDFDEESVIISNGEVSRGKSAIGEFFAALFAEVPEGSSFDLITCLVEGEHVYITWKAESDSVAYEFATDTFFIQDGIIRLQTVGFVKRAK